MDTHHFMTQSRNSDQRMGFTLIELIPAISMLLVILLVSMKSLLIGQWMQDVSMRKSVIVESYKQIQQEWRANSGTAAACRKLEDGQWEIIKFPNESWLPDNGNHGDYIEWRRREEKVGSIPVVTAEYRMAGVEQWTRWVSKVEKWNDL